MPRCLPIDYAVRNLARRPLRTALTAGSCALVAALLAATTAFVGGLSKSAASQGRADVGILLSRVSESDVLRSTVPAGAAAEVAAAVEGIARPGGVPAVSPEIHVGTHLRLGTAPSEGTSDPHHEAFVRGVTERALLVHDAVTIVDGAPPGPGEVLVGRLVPESLGLDPARFAIGETLRFENGSFRVCGHFVAPGTTIESELWAPLTDLRSLTRREDASALFVRLERPEDLGRLELFAQRRLDLELNAIPSTVYYAELAAWFAPIQALAWVLAAMIAGAALSGAANTLSAAVADRTRELAALRALGYRGAALVLALMLEGLLLSAAGGLAGLVLARALVQGATVGIAMGAFELEIGPRAVLAALLGVLALGLFASLPAALRVLRLPVALALKES
jgi:hypothetical protein